MDYFLLFLNCNFVKNFQTLISKADKLALMLLKKYQKNLNIFDEYISEFFIICSFLQQLITTFFVVCYFKSN